MGLKITIVILVSIAVIAVVVYLARTTNPTPISAPKTVTPPNLQVIPDTTPDTRH